MKRKSIVLIIPMLIAIAVYIFCETQNSNNSIYSTFDYTLDLSTELKEYKNCKDVPLLMQYDYRWKNIDYAGDKMKFSGCGPTCLSMVSIYLLKNTKITPTYVADFAEKNGYSINGNGSKWTLISEGERQLGLNIKGIPLDKSIITGYLQKKSPIICIMGPGDFTTTGHFIVMTEYTKDNKIKINDPNSKHNSEKLWNYDDIYSQIRNLWVCTA